MLHQFQDLTYVSRGVREMSVINTPPEERLPVQTYVVEYDMNLVADAIKRELARGGTSLLLYIIE